MTKARILADYVAGGTTAAEFDYMDGVTSNVQTQMDAKAPTASPTFTGGMTVDGATVFNEASADVDFRVESNGNANMLVVDASTDRVGIGTATPAKELEVKGSSSPGLAIGNTTNDVSWEFGVGWDTGTDSKLFVRDLDDGRLDMLFDGTGKIGINTSAPSTNLHINGTAKSPLIEGELIYSHVFEWTSNASPSNNLDGLTYGNIGSGGSVYFFNLYWGNSTLGDSYGHKRTMCLYRGDYGGLNLINDFDNGYGYRSGTAGFQGYPYISNPGTGSTGQTVAVPFQLTGGGSGSYGAAMYVSVHRIDYRDNDSLFQTD